MAQEPHLRQTDPAFVVSDVVEALGLCTSMLQEIDTTGLERARLIDFYIMLSHLHVQIAALLSVTSRHASEVVHDLWDNPNEPVQP